MGLWLENFWDTADPKIWDDMFDPGLWVQVQLEHGPVIFGDPKIGDIMVFHPPQGAETDTCGDPKHTENSPCDLPTSNEASVNFIKRVVAGPGDRISVQNGHVVLNGKLQKESFISDTCNGDAGRGCTLPKAITVPPGHWFMMGDNRGESDDSRFWGPVPRGWIIGEAFATYWPPSRIGIL